MRPPLRRDLAAPRSDYCPKGHGEFQQFKSGANVLWSPHQRNLILQIAAAEVISATWSKKRRSGWATRHVRSEDAPRPERRQADFFTPVFDAPDPIVNERPVLADLIGDALVGAIGAGVRFVRRTTDGPGVESIRFLDLVAGQHRRKQREVAIPAYTVNHPRAFPPM
jgi:hypothetical protein